MSVGENHHEWTGMTPPESFPYPAVALQARGELACFTRPEHASERVSYPLMTPTAAVGVLSSVFWKPQFRWVVDRIDVLAPIAWQTIRRNEVSRAGQLDVEEHRTQRMTLHLRDVHYRIHGHVWVHPEARDQDAAKWRDQFNRRVNRGASFRTPCLGMSECLADVTPVDEASPVDWTEDLGVMLHSITYDDRTEKETYDWFDARIDRGVLPIPRLGLIAQHNAEISASP